MASGVADLLARCRVTDGRGFRLKDHHAAAPAAAMMDRADADLRLRHGVERLAGLQERLFADGRHALLCVFQAMDAGGKDGTIKHVMTGVNPQGVEVTAFKAPGPEELAHDFLWRVHRAVPARGRIGIFNRSHYEEVLTVRVHAATLERERLDPARIGARFWEHRLQDIAAFERHLGHEGVLVQKFFLNVSREEQRRRFLARLETPAKNWKFSASDIEERGFWDAYMDCYEAAIAATATPHAPWYVIPADHKPFAHLLVVQALIDRLDALDLHAPEPTEAQRAQLEAARRALEAEEQAAAT